MEGLEVHVRKQEQEKVFIVYRGVEIKTDLKVSGVKQRCKIS